MENNKIIAKKPKKTQVGFQISWTKMSDRIVRFFRAIQKYFWAGITNFRLILDIIIFFIVDLYVAIFVGDKQCLTLTTKKMQNIRTYNN